MTMSARLSLLAVLGSMAMVVLDAGMLNVALPSLSAALGSDPANVIWAVSVYQMALLVGLLPSAQLAERFGHRELFTVGIVTYLVSSVLCAAAPNLSALVVARLFQGLGGAVIMALGIAILRTALGTDRLGVAIGWNALVVALSSAAAPMLAAAILAIAPWPWLFLAKLPIGLVALGASTGFPPSHRTRSSIDIIAMMVHAACAAAVLVAFERMAARPLMAICLFLAVIATARWMVAREKMREAPLWPVDLLASQSFRTSVAASIACFAGQSAGLVALPLFLQLGLKASVAETALVMTCWPVAVALTAPMAGRLADRLGSSILCGSGGFALGIGLGISAAFSTGCGIGPFVVAAIISGIGFGLFQVPNNRNMFLSAPPDRAAAAGGMQGSARLCGQTLGVLLVGLLLTHYRTEDAARIGLGLAAGCALVASLVSIASLPRSAKQVSRWGKVT